MTNVFKYVLTVADRQQVTVPGFVELLSVVVQYDNLVLYARVDQSREHAGCINVLITGTGHNIDQELVNWRFMGSHLMMGGRLVWHVWTDNDIMLSDGGEVVLST